MKQIIVIFSLFIATLTEAAPCGRFTSDSWSEVAASDSLTEDILLSFFDTPNLQMLQIMVATKTSSFLEETFKIPADRIFRVRRLRSGDATPYLTAIHYRTNLNSVLGDSGAIFEGGTTLTLARIVAGKLTECRN